MAKAQNRPADTPAKSGESAWQEAKRETAARNDQARKAGKAERSEREQRERAEFHRAQQNGIYR
jgi:hypothetical protein